MKVKTSPNQKAIKVSKEKCDTNNLYAAINLDAMENAARALKAGAFKLWIYFAKNQNGYEFALSNKAVEENFGIKKDQYDTAIKELIEKGYLIETSSNHFTFEEKPTFEKQEKTTFKNGEKPLSKVVKNHNQKQENPITNITDNTNNTINNTEVATSLFQSEDIHLKNQEEKEETEEMGTIKKPIVVEKEWLAERYNHLQALANGLFYYNHKFYKMR